MVSFTEKQRQKKTRGLVDGREGDALFWWPFSQYFREDELPSLFQKVSGLDDDRLIAIVTALLVEGRIDRLLGTFLPRYSRLTEATDFTFSMKINLLESLALIPPTITKAAHCLRKIRNEFAHDLDKINLENLPNKIINPLKTLRDEIYRGKEAPHPGERPLKEVFRQVTFFCTVGLDAYVVNVCRLRSEIDKPDFVEHLAGLVEKENQENVEQIMAQGVISEELQGNLLVQRYAKGLTYIKSLPPAEGETYDPESYTYKMK